MEHEEVCWDALVGMLLLCACCKFCLNKSTCPLSSDTIKCSVEFTICVAAKLDGHNAWKHQSTAQPFMFRVKASVWAEIFILCMVA